LLHRTPRPTRRPYEPANLFVFDFADVHGGGTSPCSTSEIEEVVNNIVLV